VNFKVILLMVAMTALFVLAGGALGGTTGMLAAFAIAALMNRFAWFSSDQAALRAYGARLVSQ
jgi:heat shock protein HtpX